METNNYKLILVMRAIGPITQMSGRSGNELIINRSRLMHNGEVVAVPSVSANSIRHAAVREPGGIWLIINYGLEGRVSKDQLRLLINGGNNASKSGGAESLSLHVRLRETMPLLGLMGCGLPDGPKPGTLRMSEATLLCDESKTFIESVTGGLLELPDWLRPARTCVGKWTHYRHDGTEQHASMLEEPDQDAGHSGMIFSGEAIMPGALMVSEIRLENATELELGALLWSLNLWQRDGGILGGMAARGNGRTESMVHAFDGDDGPLDLDSIANEYAAYAISKREEAVALLDEIYAPPAKKEKAARKKKEVVA